MYPKQTIQISKAASQLEWQTCDNEKEWQLRLSLSAIGDLGPQPSLRPRWPVRQWRLIFIALALLSGVVGWTRYEAQKGIARIEAELEERAQIDSWTASKDGQKSNSPFAIAELDSLHPLTSSVQLLSLSGDIAVVRLTLQPGPEERPLRQTRLYRRAEKGWQRMPPSMELWGSPRRRQSRFFDFQYYAQDEEAVAAVVTIMDDLYSSLTINFQPLLSAPAATGPGYRSR